MDRNPRRDDAHGTFVAPSVRLQRRCRQSADHHRNPRIQQLFRIALRQNHDRLRLLPHRHRNRKKGHGSDNPDNPNDPDDPDTPPTDYKYVARVDYKLTDNREEGATTTVSQSFDYDEENRVARITENYHSTDEYSYKDNGTEIYTLDRRILL